MDLITQIQGIGYSFVYGIIFTFVYHFIYSHLIKIKIKFIYFIMQCCFGIIFAAIYFIGLLKINEGILRAYFLVSVLAGYVVYQNLMHEKMYIMIVKINQKLTRLFKPVRFVFLKFDGIIGSIKKMTKKRLKKVYKPMAYLFIGCFLIYILLSQAMSVFSRTAEIDKLEKEVAIVKKEKKDLQNEVSLLNDDDYVTRYARENYVFTKDGEQVVILPDIDQEK